MKSDTMANPGAPADAPKPTSETAESTPIAFPDRLVAALFLIVALLLAGIIVGDLFIAPFR